MYLCTRSTYQGRGGAFKRQLYTRNTEFGGNPILIQITTLASTGS